MSGPPVPDRYRGVWRRTLLESPHGRDDTSWVHWLQTAHHHADLRVPAAARQPADHGTPPGFALALQQGFAGRTEVRVTPEGEQCWWHRELDYQPPSATPDAGWMRFETPDRLVETGVHGEYLEVWERLPDSTGPTMAWTRDGGRERLLRAGDWLALVQARPADWPADTAPGMTLLEVVKAHPDRLVERLDMTIAFGRWIDGVWHIERATRPEMEGRRVTLRIDPAGVVQASGDEAMALTMEGAVTTWTAAR